MGAAAIAGLVFLVVGGAALAGLALARALPCRHLDDTSRDAVRLVAGFLASLSALVLGLLVASAKANYDERNSQLHHIAADVVALDRTLLRYGDGAQEGRAVLRAALADALSRRVVDDRPTADGLVQPIRDARLVSFPDRLQALEPRNDGQRSARERALQLADGIAATRMLMTESSGGSIPSPFLLVLVSWLSAMFMSFGLFARANAVVIGALLAGAISVAGAVFLILELDRPLDGMMRLSTEPLRHAVEMIGN
ncbi:MAG: hypothetical protein BGO51_14940 [Rhodospirillales bacterium 69-11]|nr:MAG: hypothetical protein BGO51_14940 [Rhodospirillales bacterium 69-11]